MSSVHGDGTSSGMSGIGMGSENTTSRAGGTAASSVLKMSNPTSTYSNKGSIV